jgi:glutaredoxin 3
MSTVVLWISSCATTLKGRTDITKIKHILDTKKIEYEEVDLSLLPHRRQAMLDASDGVITLPQLHINGHLIGSADDVQEYEDWGELNDLLAGVPLAEVVAASAAAAAATAAAHAGELAAAQAALATLNPTTEELPAEGSDPKGTALAESPAAAEPVEADVAVPDPEAAPFEHPAEEAPAVAGGSLAAEQLPAAEDSFATADSGEEGEEDDGEGGAEQEQLELSLAQ